MDSVTLFWIVVIGFWTAVLTAGVMAIMGRRPETLTEEDLDYNLLGEISEEVAKEEPTTTFETRLPRRQVVRWIGGNVVQATDRRRRLFCGGIIGKRHSWRGQNGGWVRVHKTHGSPIWCRLP